MSVGPRSRWDQVRAEKRRDSSAGLPVCSECKKPSVLDPCRECDIATKSFSEDVTPDLGAQSCPLADFGDSGAQP